MDENRILVKRRSKKPWLYEFDIINETNRTIGYTRDESKDRQFRLMPFFRSRAATVALYDMSGKKVAILKRSTSGLIRRRILITDSYGQEIGEFRETRVFFGAPKLALLLNGNIFGFLEYSLSVGHVLHPMSVIKLQDGKEIGTWLAPTDLRNKPNTLALSCGHLTNEQAALLKAVFIALVEAILYRGKVLYPD